MKGAESSPRLFGAAEVCLGRQRSPQHDVGPHMVPYLRAANVKDGVLDLSDVKSMNFEPSEQKAFALRAGDILITEGSGSLSAVGASAVWNDDLPGTVCFQNTLVRLRPRPGISYGRYLGWWARAAYASGQFASVASGASIYHLSAERVKGMPISVTSVDEQRRIADFLDAEVEKIDDLVSQRKAHNALFNERMTSRLEQSLIVDDGGWSPTRLKYLFASARNGLWGEDATGGLNDVTCVRVADFLRGSYRADPTASTLRSVPAEVAGGRLLRPGDILLEKSGGGEQAPVGFAVTFDSNVRSVCSNFVAALRVADGVDSRFACLVLAAYYRSGRNVPYIKQSTGIQNLDGGAYLAQEVRVPSQREQAVIAHRFDLELDQSLSLCSTIDHQVGMLSEHRQALITAAVTGQIDVTTGRGVDV